MPQYRLEVWRHDRLWCRIDADTPWAREAIADLAGRLPAAEGYRLAAFAAEEERRLLSSQGGRIEVLAREPLWREAAVEGLRQT